jgi:enamine deaminase RidA (YjgF/YER057c/UK114 family)
MTKKIFSWLGKEFVALSAEAKSGGTAAEQARQLFRSFNDELKTGGLSLDNTVRSRLWGSDRQSRNLGSEERTSALSGKARSASSSYIAPAHFDSNALVALDLLAMRPSRPGIEKTLQEYEPPIVPLRYLIYDSIVVLSGVTAVLPTLDNQLADILPRISGSLTDAGTSWECVVKVSFYLHRSQKPETLRELFRKMVKAEIPRMDYSFVDGYSAEGKLIEIEVTATK